ncbi:type II secretion system F family protein [Paenibacillus thailandensis]|uniref:Type II secretion system F family protein n=1 Tax=Paenibacillus thailandensis TaxID=393250 RepID=A0ABW5QX79_9BACL
MLIAVTLLFIIVWGALIGARGLQQALKLLLGTRSRNQKQGGRWASDALRELLLIKPFAEALDKYRLYDRLQLHIGSYHTKLTVLKGNGWSFDQTKLAVAEAAAYGYAAMILCSVLAAAADEPLLLAMGFVVAMVLALRPFLEANRQVERRKQDILLELPEAISKLLLLVSAGETTLQAMARCLEGKDADRHPLYKEWRTAVRSLETGDSFSTALERFNRSCAVQEVSIFTTVLLLNYRRGGEHFTLALRELSYTLWEKRKAVARSRGEEASSKLVFPLVGILLALMVLVAAPAVLLMS